MLIRHRCWAAVWGLSVMEAEGPHLALQPGFAAGSHEARESLQPSGPQFPHCPGQLAASEGGSEASA